MRASELAPGQLLTLWVIDEQGHLVGGVLASELLRADAGARVSSLIETAVPTVSPETELPEVARLMADFNLLAIPVIDADEKPIGVVAVDDVIELLLPTSGAGAPEPRAAEGSAAWTGADALVTSLGGPTPGVLHCFHAMDDEGIYQDGELPRSSGTAAAVMSVTSRPGD